MSDRNDTSPAVLLLAIAFVGLMGLSWWVGSSAIEAKTFNRITGSHVSTWEAMFVTLRVMDQPKAP